MKDETENKLPLILAVVAAIGASACCFGPLLLLALGISGAWISNLTLLEPYRPFFIFAVLVLFGFAGWKVYRPVEDCDPGTACVVPQGRKRQQAIFWLTAFIALVLLTSNYWIVWFA
jgi:mercuric ion transport protein